MKEIKIEIISDFLSESFEKEEILEKYAIEDETFEAILNEYVECKNKDIIKEFKIAIAEKRLHNSERALEMYRQTMAYIIRTEDYLNPNTPEETKERMKFFEKEVEKNKVALEKLTK